MLIYVIRLNSFEAETVTNLSCHLLYLAKYLVVETLNNHCTKEFLKYLPTIITGFQAEREQK